MTGKREIDRKVAAALDMPFMVVQRVTGLFLQEAAQALLQDFEVTLEGLGTLSLTRKTLTRAQVANLRTFSGRSLSVNVGTRFTVRFRKSPSLRQAIRAALVSAEENTAMDKFAVNETLDQETLEKVANKGCPRCGQTPARHGRTLVCPRCGSEPFETASDRKKDT